MSDPVSVGESLVGMPILDACMLASKHGCLVRVVQRGDNFITVTAECRPNRINVAVNDKDVVVDVLNCG